MRPPSLRLLGSIPMVAVLASLGGCTVAEDESVGSAEQALSLYGMTTFDPATGYGWDNGDYLKNVWTSGVLDVDIHTEALCGGMAFSMLDYYFAGRPIPNHFYAPASGTELREYVYQRQLTSIFSTSNLAKWAELNQSEGRMGRTMTREYLAMKALVDDGKPAILGGIVRNGGLAEGHQVIVYGYYRGLYDGQNEYYRNDVELYVLDPNWPRKPLTLVYVDGHLEYKERENCGLDGVEDLYCMQFDGMFVQDYVPLNPPHVDSIPNYPVNGVLEELAFEFINNGDGLDGGSHNVNLTLHLADKSTREFTNLNGGAHWDGNGEKPGKETVRALLNPPVSRDDILSVTISDTFAGGIDGKNWDMTSVRVLAVHDSVNYDALNADTNPKEFAGPRRFTGRDDPFRFLVNEKEGYVSRLQFTLETGENGIDAQPYNMWDAGEELEIVVHNSDGSIQIVPRVDQQRG